MKGFMFPGHADEPTGLFGISQKGKGLRLPAGKAPQLEVAWGSFRQSLASSFFILVSGPIAPKKFLPGNFFRDCWVERKIPRRAVAAAALWHVALYLLPWPELPASQKAPPAFQDFQLAWSGPVEDLPLLNLPGKKAEPSPRGEPGKPLPPKGADAFHPRQRIFTDPSRPNHPRQTLINPAAPPAAPKILPNLPNIVQLPAVPQPARPKISISQADLAKLRPRERRALTVETATAPDAAPNLELQPSDLSFATPPNAPERPKLPVMAASAPRAGPRKQAGEVAPAPEIGAPLPGVAGGAPSGLIALSATPAAPSASVQVPEGNLSARVSISPEGTQRGVPGGAANGTPGATGGSGGAAGSSGGTDGGAGGNGLAVSISGGHPENSTGLSGLGGKSGPIRVSPGRPQPGQESSEKKSERAASSPPNFGALPPGAKPEEVFGGKRVYTLHVNMPNLNSVTGSWILSFSELRDETTGRSTLPAGELSGPAPLRKVDPRYPPAMKNERIEGEVILYAVIRKDGSVDSIQLVRGLDEQLDANAMEALSRWRFRPDEMQGVPVELEVIVRIPFRAYVKPY